MCISLYSQIPHEESEEDEESEPEPEPVPPKKVEKVAKMPQKSIKREVKEPSKTGDTKKSKEEFRQKHESRGDRFEKSVENGVLDDDDKNTHEEDKSVEENIISKDDSVEVEIIAEENNSTTVSDSKKDKTVLIEDDKTNLGGETNVSDEHTNEHLNSDSKSQSDTDSTRDLSSTGKHNWRLYYGAPFISLLTYFLFVKVINILA